MHYLRDMLKTIFGGTSVLERMVSFLTRRNTFSQFGEDVHVRAFYDRLAHDNKTIVKEGLIVDVGSFRPLVYSNSYTFVRDGWRGINIDPTPGSKALFDKVRPGDVNIEAAIGPTSGKADFFLFGRPSVWNTMDERSAHRASLILGVEPKKISIDVFRLDDVLARHMNCDNFEILLIDAEGYDLEILESNDFAKYRPRVILIEVHDLSVETICNHEVFKFLRDQEYTLFSWINPNLMFIRNDSVLSPAGGSGS